jgi:hypothetical protein
MNTYGNFTYLIGLKPSLTYPEPVIANWGQDVRRVVRPAAADDDDDEDVVGELVTPEVEAAAAAAAFR